MTSLPSGWIEVTDTSSERKYYYKSECEQKNHKIINDILNAEWQYECTEYPKELECCICLSLLEDPVMHKCGNLFCSQCITNLTICPLCRDEINENNITGTDKLPLIIQNMSFGFIVVKCLKCAASCTIRKSFDPGRKRACRSAIRPHGVCRAGCGCARARGALTHP